MSQLCTSLHFINLDEIQHGTLDFDNNNNNTLIYIAPACRMTSEALADSSSRATECLTEK